ncbi:MAG: hypothetical protein ABSH38_01845 [Verrucomicrobiota bacterium]|jgi:hypothetical protein
MVSDLEEQLKRLSSFETDPESRFLFSVLAALYKTERVLMFYCVAPERRTKVDLKPYVGALSALCREHGKNLEGVAEFQSMQRLLDRQPERDVKPDEFVEGFESVKRFSQWLLATFREACGPACAHPEKNLNSLCERCHANATVHTSIVSASGIEWHEFCESCHREIKQEETDGGTNH